MKENYDVVIIGAGAGGLMCAGWLRTQGNLRVALVDGNAKAGAKLRVSGGGRCNITNVDVQSHHYLGDSDFVEAVLEAFGKEALLEFLELRGLVPVLRKGRYYFCERSSEEIISLLLRECEGATFCLGENARSVRREPEGFVVKTERRELVSPVVVVATGGASFAPLGATDFGLGVAKTFGHAVTPFAPALAGLTLQPQQGWMKELSGVSLPVRIEVDGRTIEEDLLFAHRGISGPAVLSASLYWHRGTIAVDFAPENDIVAACRGSNKQVSTVMGLPRRFARLFLEHLGIEDMPCRQLGTDALQSLRQLHRYEFAPAGTFGFAKAEASKGGVQSAELNPYTMESLRCEGLYFIGEVVDVTGELGGYNFQWAFGSGVVAARAIIEGGRQ